MQFEYGLSVRIKIIINKMKNKYLTNILTIKDLNAAIHKVDILLFF